MVETRKVQVTGGSTFTVSIPKEWATENGVEAGSRVEFHPEGESLVLTPATEDGRTEGSIDISGLNGEELRRVVMTMYVSGFDIITFRADRITTSQRRTVREATQSLVGLEVLEETGDRVVVRDLLDSSELSIHNAVDRMRLISGSMLEDAVTALATDDSDLARDVIQRDDDVDRLYMVVSRIFRSTLRSPKAIVELGLPRESCFDYHSTARQLERIADHATKIAHLSLELDGAPPENVVESLKDLRAAAAEVIEDATAALVAEDADEATRLANSARERVRELDGRARQIDELLRELDPARAQMLGLIVDSLSRAADYGGNIAETALQKAAPTP
ncbi:MAG: phosphate uptake regulator PhoU [Haloarcula sp.]